MSCKPSCYYILLYTKCVKNLTIVVILSTLRIVKKHLRESLWEFFLLLLFDTEVDSFVSVSVPQQLWNRIQVWLVLWTKPAQLCVNYFNTKHANLVTCLHGDLSAKRKVKPPPWNTSTRSSEWSTSTFTWTKQNSSPSQSKAGQYPTASSNNPRSQTTSWQATQITICEFPSDTSSGINLNFQWNQRKSTRLVKSIFRVLRSIVANCRLLKLSAVFKRPVSKLMYYSISLLKRTQFQFWIRSRTESAARSLAVSTGRCWIRVYIVTL